ncbi:MAG: metal-sensitive transcriptional regulator [Bacillota bacterium]
MTEKRALINRLSRLEGQIRGVKKMIEEERECEEIVSQLSAIHSALESVTKRVLVSHLSDCLTESTPGTEQRTMERIAGLIMKTRL